MRISGVILLGLCCLASGFGQTTDRTSVLDRALDQRSTQSLISKENAMDQIKTFPMEGAIDPKNYILGPSDLMHVALWGPVSLNYSLPVTPEGTLIIPTVGEIHVGERRLSDVKKQATDLVKKRYPTSEVTVTLLRPRSFVVSLKGTVTKPGQYIATAVERVEKIIAEGAAMQYPTTSFSIPAVSQTDGLPIQADTYKPPKINQKEQLYEYTSTRNIKLIRRNKDTLRVDIPKYYATHDDRYNPFLLDGDIIDVPQKTLRNNGIMVYGAVNTPATYEYADGDNLVDMIQIADGLLPSTDPDNVVLTRTVEGTNQHEENSYSLIAIRKGIQKNPLLFPGDKIFVKEKKIPKFNYRVTLVGEVRQVGAYPISETGATLSKVIQNAGGFTEHALLSASYVLRKEDKLKDIVDPRIDILRNLRAHELNLVDSLIFFLDLKIGRQTVVVDFKKLFEDKDSTQNIALRDDDIIYIASDLHSVLVQGQVANAGYVAFATGMDYQYYVKKAGGFSESAVEGDIKIIKKGSLEWKDPAATTIESGDQIWVPKKPRKDFSYWFAVMRDGAQIAAAIVTIAWLIASIQNLR
ncbi:MAG: SLBB domain-containing protein [Ignavibacteriales bacterium]|nr:SLBB domain-containing protein [Ignavibacteriales bacterium]